MNSDIHVSNVNCDDMELVQSFRNGNKRAFDLLFKRYYAMTKNFCANYIGNKEDAEETCQDVFRKVYEHLGKFKGNSSFKTWLFRITRNTCCNKVHSLMYRIRKKTVSIDAPVPCGHDDINLEFIDNNTPRTGAISTEYMESLHRAILSLAPQKREIIILHDIQGMSYEEIAEITGKNVVTLRSIVSRARAEVLMVIRGNKI
ncbi:MAG: RNA polymerase sigma factor [Candidatus Auribacterota bacterium]